ncbi:MAG: S-layer homology domain-containing protein [Caryophanon sp.]|nr:S-layer homology domain-containing protein [Caryophanon sp.]
MANQPKKYQKFVATAATATLVATAVVPAASADTKFSDIATYATEVQEEVLFLAGLGVINGFEDGTFKPAQNITRGQAVKMIGRFLEAQGVEAPANWATEQSFSDIAVDRTDRDLVKYAALVKEAGVFQGNGSVLNPSGFTTRENMALILDRLIGQLTGKTAVELAEGLENNVSDLANAKEESRAAIAALNALGVSNAEEFKPKNNTQRVHFASFLARMIELAEEQNAEAGIESVQALSKTKVVVTFNTPVDEVTVENFKIEGAVVNGVELSEDKTVATLDVSGLEYNTEYTVAVADVKVDGEAVDFGSQSFSTPAVTQDFELRVTAAEAEVVADGADNVVIKFELLNSVGEVDTNADNMVLEIGTTFGNLATNRVTIQDGVGQVVLSSEFSSKEMIAKVTAQVIEASTDYKDLIGKVAGETTVKFIPAASVLDPNALTFLGAESNQADRVVVYFDKPVSPATFVKTEEDGTFKTYRNEMFDIEVQEFKDDVTFIVEQGAVEPGADETTNDKTIVGLAAVPGNDKALEIILAKDLYNEEGNKITDNILKDNAKVDLTIKIGETINNRSFTLTDSRKPEFTGVTVSNLRTLDLKFSEAVDEGSFSIDGIWSELKGALDKNLKEKGAFKVEFGEFDAATGIDKRDTATLALGTYYNTDLKVEKQRYFPAGQHSITVTQLKDFAAATDQANISSTQTLNFDVYADLTAPTATATVESPEQFRVTFNKDFGTVLDHSIKEVAEAKAAKEAAGETFDELTYIFNDSLRVYDTFNKEWVKLSDLTADGRRSGTKVFKTGEALKELEQKLGSNLENLLVAKQVYDKDDQPIPEVVVELTEDWTKLFNDDELNSKDTYENYQFKFDIDARTFENAANGITNSSLDLNLNYEGSPLNTADNTSPEINEIKQVPKEKHAFEVFLNEPVKLRFDDVTLTAKELGLTQEAFDKLTPEEIATYKAKKIAALEDNAGRTESVDQQAGAGVPTVLVEFQGKDESGKAVVIKAEVEGYSSFTDKDGDSVLRVVTEAEETLQDLVDLGYNENWTLVVRSVTDDIGNAAKTLTKDFSLVAKQEQQVFQIKSNENFIPGTRNRYENEVFAFDYNGEGKDRLEVTFTEAVNFAGNDNLTSVYNWTLNGTKLSELSNVESIDLVSVAGKASDFEKVVITFANDRAFGATSNVVSVTKGIKSLYGTVLTGEYEVVAETIPSVVPPKEDDKDPEDPKNPTTPPTLDVENGVVNPTLDSSTMYDGIVYVTRVTNPVAGLTYNVYDTSGNVVGTATATEQDAEDGSLDIELNETVTNVESVKSVSNDRIAVADETITVKLNEGEDLSKIAAQYEAAIVELDKPGTAVIGNVLIKLPSAADNETTTKSAITEILTELSNRDKDAAALIGQEFKVPVYASSEVSIVNGAVQITEGAEPTIYTIKF